MEFAIYDVVKSSAVLAERRGVPGSYVTELLRIRGSYQVVQEWHSWDGRTELLSESDKMPVLENAERVMAIRLSMAEAGLL